MADDSKTSLVLVADDEVHTTVMLERIFEREGYRVHCAYDGVSALEDAKTMLPDLILLDIQMPGMSGFDVLHELRQTAATANIPTILITAKARQPSDVAHGLNLGADDYIYKPFDPRELLARAESKMKARRLEDNLQRRTEELAALLRVGDELNQTLEVNDVMALLLSLTLDLLPGNLAAIYRFDEKGAISAQRSLTMRSKKTYDLDSAEIVKRFNDDKQPSIWPGGKVLLDQFPSGMVIPLKHADSLLGLLLIGADEKNCYDDNHFRLFRGIGRQAALSLRNGELYEILMHQNEHLEDIVVARTADLQSTQQMLIRSEKLASIGHLAASIAHEINNPLQPIRIHLEHMLEDIQSNDEIEADSVKSIQESIERITRIVSQLLEFAGKRSPSADVEFLDIKRTLEGVINLNRKLFEQKGLMLNAGLGELPSVYGSKDQLEQVFMNLALNAEAAMDKGGKLDIDAQVSDKYIVVRFRDTGRGIPEDQINNIFDPFYSTKANGSGLGLFVSYGIIQNHHGSIEVESVVGKGTTFTIKLPVDEAANA